MDEESKSTFGENPFQIVLKKEDFPHLRTEDVFSAVENEIIEGINQAQTSWVEQAMLSKQKDPLNWGVKSHLGSIIQEIDNYSDLYRKERDEFQHQQNLMNFPETSGPEIRFNQPGSANGSAPAGLIFEETGMLGRIHEFTEFAERKKAGGVEPPAFITAKDMADELEALPKSFVEAALDPEETGEVEIILGELKIQGDEVAVVMTRKEEFDDLNLFNIASEPTLQRVNPVVYGNPARDPFAEHILNERSMVVLRDPGLFR